MNKSIKIGIIAILIAVIALGVAVFKDSGTPIGGNTSYQKQSFLEGFYGGTGRQFEVSRTGLLTTSGDITVTTSNTATSTIAVGCIQMNATSTATNVRLLFHSTGTPVVISGVASGFVAWGYGTCPF